MSKSDQPHKRWIGCDVEADFLGEDRKHGKRERKRASSKDRSKYKKTDKDKLAKTVMPPKQKESHLRGRVLSITPQGIVVEYAGATVICGLRGTLKKEKTQFKNLITVGDWVLFELGAHQEGYIAYVEPRYSTLSRADNLSRKKEQLIAANIDQVLITVSVVKPELKSTIVDRYIIAAEKGNMQPIIVVNKIDLFSSELENVSQQKEYFDEFVKAYQKADIPVIAVSCVTQEGIDQLRQVMKDKASVFSGPSGTGKSSLINAVAGFKLRTGGVVERTGKGSHTTTTANLLSLPFGGWCIDTPGIKSFGVWELSKEEIPAYFKEIFAYSNQCKYPDCSHMLEENCAVIDAVRRGDIALMRYQSYFLLMEDASKKHLRR